MSLLLDDLTRADDDGGSRPPLVAAGYDRLTQLGIGLRVALAALCGGAAAIHFGMIPSHAGSSTVEAVGFGVAGWLGVIAAVVVLQRPSHRTLLGVAGLHLLMIGIWIVSRTSGLPVGAHSGQPAAVGTVDVLATVLGSAAVVGALVLVARPAWASRSTPGLSMFGGLVGGAAMVASSIALVSPAARNHASASHGNHSTQQAIGINEGLAASGAGDAASPGHLHPGDPSISTAPLVLSTIGASGVSVATPPNDAVGGTATPSGHAHGAPSSSAGIDLSARCDLGFNPVSFWEETQIVNGGAAVATTQGSAGLDTLIRATKSTGAESDNAALVVDLGRASDADYQAWVNWLPTFHASMGHGSVGAPDDNGGHGGHVGPQAWIPMTDQAECDQLASELERAKTVALSYPTPADAEAGGWRRVTGYVPGIAAHYMNFGLVDGEFDIDQPEMLLYDGTGPDASMVGLSYFMIHDSDFEPTQGFTGPNDHFHRHIGLCVQAGGGVIGDSATTEEECAARGGTKTAGFGGWMNHVWIVPGCESPWGMFSGATPILDRSLGDASGTDGGGCAGSGVYDRFDLAPGTADNVPPALVGNVE